MSNELIDRYVYAVSRHLDPRERDEVARELESLIGDMLDERCGVITPTDKDVRVVLTELGTPQEVAMQYSGQKDQALISGTYYLHYKRILKLVLPIVAVAIPFAVLLGFFFDEQTVRTFTNPIQLYATLFGQLVGGMFGGVIQAFAIITVIFAIMERRQVDFSESDLAMDLPEVPQRKEQIMPWEPIFGIVFSILAAIAFLILPEVIGVWFGEADGWIPVFSTSVIRSLWLPIAVWLICGIAKEIVKLIDGRYSLRVALVTTFANAIMFFCAFVVMLNPHILNPQFTARIEGFLISEGILSGTGGEMIAQWIVHANLLFLAIIGFALLIDSLTSMFKAVRSSQKYSDAVAKYPI
ncbi:MAG: hypothetical protein FWD41_01055 [Actinomycetia bacterium]|nr:hypothetical protein [Actinomycetes bacterium]